MRLATFNVNSVRSRLPILERWLPQSGVDLLCLQETKVVDADFPEAPFAAMGYKAYFHGEKSYNGVALLVKEPLDVKVSFGFDDSEEPDFSTRVLLLRTEGLTVLNTYVPQGKEITHPDFEVKKRFLARVRRVIEREMSGPFAWLGDLNVAPTERDLANPKGKKDHVCFCQEIRDLFARVSEGLVDTLRKFHPEDGVYTFFDYRVKDSVNRNIGWRIDHILTSPALAERMQDCFADLGPRREERPSDHTPLVAEFA
ncbi:MAG: exodeoxyribonuclease III [Fretibacterium sp.]|nr:exodeoxyribonuclease III [Fretibacterium sp.]